MNSKMLKSDTAIFSLGGIIYGIIEIIYRGYTHWTMLITGGVCCLAVFKTFVLMKPCSVFKRCAVGSMIITFIELICGCIVNLRLNMNVWDYSDKKINFLGQICLANSIMWGLLSFPICFISSKLKRLYLEF